MARMHSRKHGQAKSRKPSHRPAPENPGLDAKKIEQKIIELGKEGMQPSQIGMILRDEHDVADAKPLIGKTITKVLKENSLAGELPEDLLAVVKKAVLIRKHLLANKHDETAKRGLILTESKVLRLTRYYKKSGKLDQSWKYKPQEASYLAE